MKNQKHLIILIIITISITSFGAGYLLTQTPRQSAEIINQQRGALIDRFSGVNDSSTPAPLPLGLLQATTDTSLVPTSAPDNDAVLYYHPDTGYVSKLDLETRKNTLISTTQLTGLTNVVWSPNKNRVVTITHTSIGPAYKYFDYSTHQNGSLGVNIKDAVFSPDSQQIAVVRSAGGDSTIEIMDFDGKNSRTILKTRLTGIKLFWQNNQTLSFIASDADASTQSFYSLDQQGNLGQLLSEQVGLAVRWSSDGTKFIYSDKQGDTTETGIFNTVTQQPQTLSIQTSANNCDWMLSQLSIICATEVQGQTSVLQIPLATGSPATLFSNLIISPREVFLSHSGNFLILVSAGDQSIWELKFAN